MNNWSLAITYPTAALMPRKLKEINHKYVSPFDVLVIVKFKPSMEKNATIQEQLGGNACKTYATTMFQMITIVVLAPTLKANCDFTLVHPCSRLY